VAKIQVIFYSVSGRVERLAEAVAAGAREVPGSEVLLARVPELAPAEMSAGRDEPLVTHSADLPLISPEQLAEADAIIVGSPTRFGSMAAPMRAFWDATGELWLSGALVGKVGAVFVGTGTQHGGHETTVLSMWQTFAHHGMVIVGVPYSCDELRQLGEVSGGSPYGAGTVGGLDGSTLPTMNELAIARFQGRHVAALARKLTRD
jgi:NAD(P)H dehydrogenase (quinone)